MNHNFVIVQAHPWCPDLQKIHFVLTHKNVQVPKKQAFDYQVVPPVNPYMGFSHYYGSDWNY